MDRAGSEVGSREDPQVGRDGRLNTFDLEFVQRSDRAPDGFVTVASPDDELGNEIVVVLRDAGALADAAVDPYPWSCWFAVGGELPGGRKEPCGRVFGVDPEFDGVAAALDGIERERFARRDPELFDDEIDPCRLFGDGVFDLDSRVHLEEEEVAARVHEELDGPGVHVSRGPGNGERRVPSFVR